MKLATIKWEPQERQLLFLNTVGLSAPFNRPNLTLRPSGSIGQPFHKAVAEVDGYGGAAGGGKTDTAIITATIACMQYPKINVGYFRREFPQLEGLGGAILRSQELISTVAKYNEQKHRWFFPNTQARIQFNHCKDEKDVYNYQSQQFDILLFDETTQFTEFQLDYLITRNRSTVEYDTFKPFTAMFTNPGNVGHGTFKERFIDIGEWEKVHEYTYPETKIKKTHIFIPSKLEDNQVLEKRDPNYRKNLATNEYNRKVLLEGSWDVFSGQVFRTFSRTTHVIKPVVPNKIFDHYLSMDWGVSGKSAFAAYLHAVVEMKTSDGQVFQRVFTYHEWYGNEKTPDQWAEEIYRDCKELGVKPVNGYVDPAMLNRQTDGSVSIGKLMQLKWDSLLERDTDKGGEPWLSLSEGGRNREARVAIVQNWLSQPTPEDLPYWLISEQCVNLIRTLPKLVYDDKKQNDVNTTQEDHGYDSVGYFLSKMKFTQIAVGPFTYQTKPRAIRSMYNAQGQELGLDIREFASQYDR